MVRQIDRQTNEQWDGFVSCRFILCVDEDSVEMVDTYNVQWQDIVDKSQLAWMVIGMNFNVEKKYNTNRAEQSHTQVFL